MTQGEKQRRQRLPVFHLLVHSPNSGTSGTGEGWARQRSGASNSTGFFRVGGRDTSTWAPTAASPAGSWTITGAPGAQCGTWAQDEISHATMLVPVLNVLSCAFYIGYAEASLDNSTNLKKNRL